jgi:hypothetical protein
VSEPSPRSGEFFAPWPIAAVALLVLNDRVLKPRFHDAVTGKLSDIAICFFLPLFVSEAIGLVSGLRAPARLYAGAVAAGVVFAGLEVVPPVTRLAVATLTSLSALAGAPSRFAMTEDWTDLLCLALVPVAVRYGEWRLSDRRRARRASASTWRRAGSAQEDRSEAPASRGSTASRSRGRR